jgi:hypothetical protein
MTKKTAAKQAANPAAAANGETAEKTLPAVAAKPPPKAKRVRRPAAARKARNPATAGRSTTATMTSRKSKSAASKPAYTTEDIALRAYFIAEKRQQLGLYGSPESDWLEAERQLREGLGA